MKRVPALQTAPQGLADYCAAHPTDATAGGDTGEEVWSRFCAHNHGADYQALRKTLMRRQQGLCAYCEQLLVDNANASIPLAQQVEHVRPKSGACGDALAWDNLMLCCIGGSNSALAGRGSEYYRPNSRRPREDNISCGQRKANEPLSPGCDPRTFPRIQSLVCVTLDGRLEPDEEACRVHGVDAAELRCAIQDRLNLNCPRLMLARKTRYANVQSVFVELADELIQDTRLTEAQRAQHRSLMVAARLQPDAHGNLCAFWSTERCALEPHASSWLQHHTTPDGTITL